MKATSNRRSKGSCGVGHATAFRRFQVQCDQNKSEFYEFLDPSEGLWRSPNLDVLVNFVTNRLLKTRPEFFPGSPRYSEISYTFYLISECRYTVGKSLDLKASEKNTFANLLNLSPFGGDGDGDGDGNGNDSYEKDGRPIRQAEDLRERMLGAVPPVTKKKNSLLAILKVTQKEFQKQNGLPDSNNKAGKLKYSEFIMLWETFCTKCPVQQLVDYQREMNNNNQ
eukprot:TRINITY_DN3437_c0_g1_i14.p1 TRINITY_DN3437_c0_g1~~TRINITY_DN3437_c0_g1_i14.p1  ORF type:complete len:224 (+),score=42.70 TRINITY_DN3437_c0_g1_i14:640-1311(+)